jgi:hypothetical protein
VSIGNFLLRRTDEEGRTTMLGVIGNREVAANFGLIWREFGPRCAIRCVGAILRGKRTTFLELVFATPARSSSANP